MMILNLTSEKQLYCFHGTYQMTKQPRNDIVFIKIRNKPQKYKFSIKRQSVSHCYLTQPWTLRTILDFITLLNLHTLDDLYESVECMTASEEYNQRLRMTFESAEGINESHTSL